MEELSASDGSQAKSKEEEDLMKKSTKKVKTHQADNTVHMEVIDEENIEVSEDCVMENKEEEVHGEPKMKTLDGNPSSRKMLYKETVLYEGLLMSLSPKKVARTVVEEYLKQDKVEDTLTGEVPLFDPKPNFKIDLEKYEDWYKPWKYSP